MLISDDVNFYSAEPQREYKPIKLVPLENEYTAIIFNRDVDHNDLLDNVA